MIALQRSKVQTQRDVLAGKSPAIQLNVNATRMSQAFAGSSYIQQMVPGEVNELVQRYRGSVAPPVDLALRERFTPNLEQSWFGALMEIINNVTIHHPQNRLKAHVQFCGHAAEEIFEGQYDFDLITDKVEEKIWKGENMPDGHLRATRISREEVVYGWLRYVHNLIKRYYLAWPPESNSGEQRCPDTSFRQKLKPLYSTKKTHSQAPILHHLLFCCPVSLKRSSSFIFFNSPRIV